VTRKKLGKTRDHVGREVNNPDLKSNENANCQLSSKLALLHVRMKILRPRVDTPLIPLPRALLGTLFEGLNSELLCFSEFAAVVAGGRWRLPCSCCS
jgi:hypothetical protein